MKGTKPYGRDLPLRFATAKTVLYLVGAPPGWSSDWHCPCHHPDTHPSFSAKPGREPGTTIVACGVCSRTKEGHAALLAYFLKRGYRLGPMKMAPPKRPERPVIVTTSIAWRALTPTERRIYELIAATDGTLPYTDFVSVGISSSAISAGLRALQALGFLGVKRSPRRKGSRRYERNRYWIERGWLDHEPERLSKDARKDALERARMVARAARKGGEDITLPQGENRSKQPKPSALSTSDFVHLSTSDSGRESYVVRKEGTRSQDNDRPKREVEKGEVSRTRARAREAVTPWPLGHVCGYACRKGCVCGEAATG